MVNNSISEGEEEEDRVFWQGDPNFPEAVCSPSIRFLVLVTMILCV